MSVARSNSRRDPLINDAGEPKRGRAPYPLVGRCMTCGDATEHTCSQCNAYYCDDSCEKEDGPTHHRKGVCMPRMNPEQFDRHWAPRLGIDSKGVVLTKGIFGPRHEGMLLYVMPGPIPEAELGALPLSVYTAEEPGIREIIEKNFPPEGHGSRPFQMYYVCRLELAPMSLLRMTPEQTQAIEQIMETNNRALAQRHARAKRANAAAAAEEGLVEAQMRAREYRQMEDAEAGEPSDVEEVRRMAEEVLRLKAQYEADKEKQGKK